MDTQNVTISIPKDILRKAKILAVERNISLSRMLTIALTDLVNHDEEYTSARSHHLSWLKKGADLGTRGEINWKRENLHER